MSEHVRIGPWINREYFWERAYPSGRPAIQAEHGGWWSLWRDDDDESDSIAEGRCGGGRGTAVDDDLKRHADSIAESLGWILERDPATEPTPGPNRVRDAAVIAEIMAERDRAFAKWGPQPYPWTCGEDDDFNGLHEIAERLEREARNAMADRAFKGLPPTRAQIVAEEAGEALWETDPKRARKELVQLGAMVIAALSECPDLWEEEEKP